MSRALIRICSLVAVLIVAFVAYLWRAERPSVPTPATERSDALREFGSEIGRWPADATEDFRSRIELSPTLEPADTMPDASMPTEEDVTVESIDPLLGGKNLIARVTDPAMEGPGLFDLERQFRTEDTDLTWSTQMESSIFEQLSQVQGLSLVTLDVECRRTICRVKLFFQPRGDVPFSSEHLSTLAKGLDFGHVVEVAPVEEDDAPMSLFYLQR